MVLSKVNLMLEYLVKIRIYELHDQAYRLEMREVHLVQFGFVLVALLRVMWLTENVEGTALLFCRFGVDAVL